MLNIRVLEKEVEVHLMFVGTPVACIVLWVWNFLGVLPALLIGIVGIIIIFQLRLVSLLVLVEHEIAHLVVHHELVEQKGVLQALHFLRFEIHVSKHHLVLINCRQDRQLELRHQQLRVNGRRHHLGREHWVLHEEPHVEGLAK